jgi:hypothetical protein
VTIAVVATIVSTVVATLISITAVSPSVVNRDEDAGRQELQTDECDENRSGEGDSPARHVSSPLG